MNIKALHERIDGLKTALANEKKWREAMRERELDQRIAERGGDTEAIRMATAGHAAARTEWYGYYQACQDQSKGLVRHLGIEPGDIKSYL